MLHSPTFDPVAIHLGPIAVHWYGLMYLVGLLGGYGLALWRGKKTGQWNSDQISDLLFYCAFGVIIGGRVGYMLFYNFPTLIHEPLSFFRVWEGGMSFHGGLLGVILAMFLYAKRSHRSLLEVADFVAPVVPLGLGAGRIGNFINGELWGKVTSVPWGIVYPNGGPLPRHPSELYEFFLEGVILFIILWWYSAKAKPRGAVSGMFVFWYGCFRFLIEFFRTPDPQYGYLLWGWVTMGQILSLPMILFGAWLVWFAYHRKTIR
jgi:phosphatidylglycerol:prolipoprotein diacylglycerol transferase